MTHLEYWLAENRVSVAELARRLGVNRDCITHLATPGAWKTKSAAGVRYYVLEKVTDATGIDIGVLIKDALGRGEPVFVEPTTGGMAAD